jgi:hypothetical protein
MWSWFGKGSFCVKATFAMTRSGLSLSFSSALTRNETMGVAMDVSVWDAMAFPSCPLWMRAERPASRGPNMPESCAAGSASLLKGISNDLQIEESQY